MTEPLEDLFEEADALPLGRARVLALEEVARRADTEAPASDLPFRARLALIDSYSNTTEKIRSFTPFAWCLAEYDADPARYGAYRDSLLWAFKWQVTRLTDFPEVPLERALDGLEDMERRYRAAGHGLNGVLEARVDIARHLGNADEAAERFRQWELSPVDELSSCEGCLPTAKVHYLVEVSRHEDAVRLAEPVLAGRLTCREQPQSMLTALLPAYVATGRGQAAAAAHLTAYRKLRADRAALGSIAGHLHFLARTGNAMRALEVLETHLPWLDEPSTPFEEMLFAAAGARALGKMTPGELVRRAGAEVPADALAGELARRARALADSFDQRNQTDAVSRLVEDQLTGSDWIDYLPLTPVAGRAHELQGESSPPSQGAEGIVPAPVLPADGSGVDELLDHFDARWLVRDSEGARAAVARIVGSSAEDLDSAQSGRVLEARGLLASDEDVRAAVSHWEEALPLLDAAGQDVRVRRTRARLGYARAALGHPEEGLAIAEGPLRWLSANDEPGSRRAGWTLMLASMLAPTRVDEAGALVAALEADTLTVEDRIRGSLISAEAALVRGELADAEATFDECVALAQAAPTEARALAHWGRARCLLSTERPGAAVADMVEVVALLGAGGRTDPLALTDLAMAQYQAGDPPAGVVSAESALLELTRSEEVDTAAVLHLRRMLADGYPELGDHAAALEQVNLIRAMLPPPDASEEVRLDHAALNEQEGDLLDRLDRDREALAAYDAAAHGYEVLGRDEDRVRALRLAAAAAVWAGQDATAEARWKSVASLLDVLPADVAGFHRAGVLRERADQARRDNRADLAGALLLQAASLYDGIGEQPLADDSTLAAAELGGPVALRQLTAIHRRQGEGTRAWYRSGYVLADALADAGKERAARKLVKRLEATR